MSELYIGLMSGTSMDGIDAALVEISGDNCHLIGSHQHDMPPALIKKLNALCQRSDNEIETQAVCSIELATCFSQAVLTLLKQCNISPQQIRAIGSHGQTIRHFPKACLAGSDLGFSLQIGHPAYIAAQTGIDVVADFRTMDMAVGGEGAPLVPAFHQAQFQSADKDRIIINIGGIANITYLPKNKNKKVIGFDTGPGNTLLDSWYKKHQQGNYDPAGQWAASGNIIPTLLAEMQQAPYFSLPHPKSTGRELFNLTWLQQHAHIQDYAAQDVQATLLELTASSISQALKQLQTMQILSEDYAVYVCGGGVHNNVLMHALQQHLSTITVDSTTTLGLDPDWVEAVAFAWLAKRHLHKQTGNLPAVTGATKEVILGGLYPA